MHSYRQTPPKDRTALWAALIVAGMLLAGAIGWMASSIANRPTQNTASKSVDAQNDQLNKDAAESDDRAKTIQSAKSDETASSRNHLSKTSVKTPEVSPRVDTPESEFSPRSVGDRGSNAKKSVGLPKLSDLTSLKNDAAKTRVKSLRPSGRRSATERGKGSKDPESISKQNSQLTKSSKSESLPAQSTAEQTSKSAPERTGEQNQFAIPQSTSDIVFYQELLVDRNPRFGIEGISELNQKFKYRAVSKITVHPGDRNGFRKVSQKVVSANLLSADSISKKSLVESVKKLVGKEFQYTLDRKQKLVSFKGTKDEPKSINFKDLTSIEGFAGDGFMVSSVMDLDGWKEMAQLTFLLPDDKKKKWKDQMSHDWGELGRWLGETHFEKKNEANGLLRIDYAHWMSYDPTTKGKSKLPFAIGEKSFKSTEAGGRLLFNRKKNRIDSLIERFQVSGEISASLLGSSTKLKMQEIQTFELKLHDQSPQ